MKSKIKNCFRNKFGMTYIELICALGLLSMIVVLFTPMLLNSYNTLYSAGERNEITYDAKTELEEALASRTETEYRLLAVKFNDMAETFKIQLRDVTSTMQEKLQTLFFGGTGSIRILSGKNIPDDTDAKKFVMQTNGIIIDTIKKNKVDASGKINTSEASVSADGKYTVVLNVYKPLNLGGGTIDFTYKTVSVDTDGDGEADDDETKQTYQISFSGTDLTTGYVRIEMAFIDENGETNTTEAFVYIEPPTIMLAGGTSDSISYYTSAGVSNGKLEIEGRKMTGSDYPSGTTFNTVEYIDTDPNFAPYYVVTGNNGVIQRLFRIDGKNTQPYINITGETPGGIHTIVDGRFKKTVAPIVWGGDRSDKFGFCAYGDTNAYHNGPWYSGDSDKATIKSDYNKYTIDTSISNYSQARYSMKLNGMELTAGEAMRNGRIIGYTLCEKGTPLRLVAERENKHVTDNKVRNVYGGFITTWENYGFDIGDFNEDVIDTTNVNNIADTSSRSDPRKVVRYNRKCFIQDGHFAYPYLKSYGSTSAADILNYGERSQDTSAINNSSATQIDITSAIYNENTGKMLYLGTANAYAVLQQVDNIHNVADYALTYTAKRSAIGEGVNEPTPIGAITNMFITGSEVAGTTVYKTSYKMREDDVGSRQWSANTQNLPDLRAAVAGTAATKTITDFTQFFVERSYPEFGPYESWEKVKDYWEPWKDDEYGWVTYYDAHKKYNQDGVTNQVRQCEFPDFNFHLGYSSDWKYVYSNITYDENKAEIYNSYERYYDLSHYGSTTKPNATGWVKNARDNLINKSSNDLYNVWFPGEFYSLIASATKDGVTVAVGYTAAGSTFQYVNPVQTTNTSTSFGGLYNDGVLAAMTAQTDRFQNLLYYKDFEKFDSTSITDAYGSTYNAHYAETKYGTHSRESIHFLCVDLATVDTNSGTNRNYYAIYGDDRGRAFVSKVASATITGQESTSNIRLVDGIRDLSTSDSATDSFGKMEEVYAIGFDNQKHRLDYYYNEINIVAAYDDVFVIGGVPRNFSDGVCFVIGKLNSTTGAVENAYVVRVHEAGGVNVEDAMVMDGYLYFCGTFQVSESAAPSEGLFAAIKFDAFVKYLNEKPTKPNDSFETIIPEELRKVYFVMTPTLIYDLDGRGI